MAHFSLFGLGSVGEKGIFRSWKDSGKAMAKSVGCGVFFQKTKRRKAFYIISHYRQRWCGFASNEVEGNVLRWQFAYNVDYVICCGIKAVG